jgi:hypothetical protein
MILGMEMWDAVHRVGIAEARSRIAMRVPARPAARKAKTRAVALRDTLVTMLGVSG